MTGAFKCSPNLCPECGGQAIEIQRRAPTDWAVLVEQIEAEKVRECVREYLRGRYRAMKTAEGARK